MSFHRHIFHLVTRTKNSEPTIPEESKTEMFRFIMEMCKREKWKLIRINSYLDHLHILIELPGNVMPDYVMKLIKGRTSTVFSGHQSFPHFRGWAQGYASFTVSYYEVEHIKNYIIGQADHHSQESSSDEFWRLLAECGYSRPDYKRRT